MNQTSKGNIYVIEDDESIRISLDNILTASNYLVQSFSSPSAFFNTEIMHPAVIILDMILPEMLGSNIQQELLGNHETPPIIFISGESSLPQVVSAIKQGAIEFLLKPFKIDDLLRAIDDGLEKDLENIKQLSHQRSLDEKLVKLTNREHQVYQLLLRGLNNQEIMRELNISLPTTKQYKITVMRKLNVKTFSQLILLSKP